MWAVASERFPFPFFTAWSGRRSESSSCVIQDQMCYNFSWQKWRWLKSSILMFFMFQPENLCVQPTIHPRPFVRRGRWETGYILEEEPTHHRAPRHRETTTPIQRKQPLPFTFPPTVNSEYVVHLSLMHVSWLWEESEAPGENPHRHGGEHATSTQEGPWQSLLIMRQQHEPLHHRIAHAYYGTKLSDYLIRTLTIHISTTGSVTSK